MLWLDTNPKRTLEEKVQRAADYYSKKYGCVPNLCFVNPKTLASKQMIGTIEVRPNKTIAPFHFWLGVTTEHSIEVSR